MITQRPVTGSLRSSGKGECVLINLDDRPSGLEMDGYDVEPARLAREPVPRHVIDRQLRHCPLLEWRDGFGRRAELVRLARLHLDEDERRAIARDDVQFSTA